MNQAERIDALRAFLQIEDDRLPMDARIFAEDPQAWGPVLRQVVDQAPATAFDEIPAAGPAIAKYLLGRQSPGQRTLIIVRAVWAIEFFRENPHHWTRHLLDGMDPDPLNKALAVMNKGLAAVVGDGHRYEPITPDYSTKYVPTAVRIKSDGLRILIGSICLEDGRHGLVRAAAGNQIQADTFIKTMFGRRSGNDLRGLILGLDAAGFSRAEMARAMLYGTIYSIAPAHPDRETSALRVIQQLSDAPVPQILEVIDVLEDTASDPHAGPFGEFRSDMSDLAQALRHQVQMRASAPVGPTMNAP